MLQAKNKDHIYIYNCLCWQPMPWLLSVARREQGSYVCDDSQMPSLLSVARREQGSYACAEGEDKDHDSYVCADSQMP